MNMVIHDMRNPTGSIEFGMQQSLDNLEQYLLRFQALKEVFQVFLEKSESIYSAMLDQSDPSISNSNDMMFQVGNEDERNRSLEQQQLENIQEEDMAIRRVSSNPNNNKVIRHDFIENDREVECEINASECEEFTGNVNIPKDFSPNSKCVANV